MAQVQNPTVIFTLSKVGVPLTAIALLSFFTHSFTCLVLPLAISIVALLSVVLLRYVSNCPAMQITSSITNDVYKEIRFWLTPLTLAFLILFVISPQGLGLAMIPTADSEISVFVSLHSLVNFVIFNSFLMACISTWSLFTVVHDCIKRTEPVPMPLFD